MDALKLLSRSTSLRKNRPHPHRITPSSGPHAQPQLFPPSEAALRSTRKRKRDEDVSPQRDDLVGAPDFFDLALQSSTRPTPVAKQRADSGSQDGADSGEAEAKIVRKAQKDAAVISTLSDEKPRAILKQHKLKVTLLNPTSAPTEYARNGKTGSNVKKPQSILYPQPIESLLHLRHRFKISSRLAGNLNAEGFTVPTEVQMCAVPILLDMPEQYFVDHTNEKSGRDPNLLTVAPTGSGKTLAFMIPLIHRVWSCRRSGDSSTNIQGIILVPTKELAGQITSEGKKLASGTGLRVALLRKGMRFLSPGSPGKDLGEQGESTAEIQGRATAKPDILVSTPGLLHSMLNNSLISEGSLADVRDLVLDEADVLLDPLFRDQTLCIWHKLVNTDLRVSFWSATMGSSIEELATSTIQDWEDRRRSSGAVNMQKAPFIRLVVGLKDSAIPNVQHKLVYAATEQGKLMGLRQLLHPASTPQTTDSPLVPPFLIFTQTIERAVALHSELLYDIPAEAGGIDRIAVLHADLSDVARGSVMTRFRKGEIWVLITTDLLSRGVDFRGVNGVINYDIPTSSAAYVHRVGRTGRAGREGGVAVTLYSKDDLPYLKHVANVVAMAQRHNSSPNPEGGMQQWMIDALPKLSKGEKRKLKKRGIESRTTRCQESNSKATRPARISSKAGFVRRTQNNRRGAVLGSQRRAQAESGNLPGHAKDGGHETDFVGFG